MISTKGLSKAAVLAALFNNARPREMGWLTAMMGGNSPFRDITVKDAEAYFANGGDMYIDYLEGRPIKVDLSNDDGFEEYLYDRDYGRGAAQKAIDSIRCDNT